MRVLHFANWYPSKNHPYTALWVRKHIESLGPDYESFVYHIEITRGPIGYSSDSEAENHRNYLLSLPFQFWKVNEVLYFLIFAYILLFRERKQYWDLMNVHIAYPLLSYFHRLKRWIKCPVVISEHWSAYHYEFNLPGSGKLDPIRKIFSHGIPVITVSKSLGSDIARFSGANFSNFVVPNIVDGECFYPAEQKGTADYFFMVSQWKDPKRPELAIEAFDRIRLKSPNIKLIIAGYGPQVKLLQAQYKDKGNIEWIGPKNAEEVGEYMRHAFALIHPSDYETFSVVCAEALACKCPVIASAVGGIPEFVNVNNGFLVAVNTVEGFQDSMEECLNNPPKMTNLPDFSSSAVGKTYTEVLESISNGVG